MKCVYFVSQRSTLQSQLRTAFKLHWLPIFRYLEENVQATLPDETKTMTTEEIETYYEACVACLRERLSYCFLKKRDPLLNNTATWSLNTRFSEIKKFGTDSDKSFLSEPTKLNAPKGTKKRKSSSASHPLYADRQRRRLEKATGSVQDCDSQGSEGET
jgi:hypothetical protein